MKFAKKLAYHTHFLRLLIDLYCHTMYRCQKSVQTMLTGFFSKLIIDKIKLGYNVGYLKL